MKLSSLLNKDDIFIGCPDESDDTSKDKFRLLEKISRVRLDRENFSQEQKDAALKAIIEREKSMTTGIGETVAIPHASLSYLKEPIGAMCISRNGVDFESIDNRPVHIIILLFVPKDQFQSHIKTLAGIARLVNEESFRKFIIESNTSDDVWKKILEKESLNGNDH